MQWVDLDKLTDVEPLNDADLKCMAEVREVLKKHGKRERFGVALLHKHFEMDDNEVLLEYSDHENRELKIQAVPKTGRGKYRAHDLDAIGRRGSRRAVLQQESSRSGRRLQSAEPALAGNRSQCYSAVNVRATRKPAVLTWYDGR